MNGHIARAGFLFQDLYLLFRVLRAASESLDSAWGTGRGEILDLLTDLPIQFGIEASLRADGSADWDILVLAKDKLEFAEVKSGQVTKEDRTVFWCRLRRELGRRTNCASQLTPILVVDPEKVESLTKWEELAGYARSFSGAPPVEEPLGNVSTGEQLLKEALWCICRPDETAEKSDPPALFAEALSALTRFEAHRHIVAQLDSKVSQLLELLFPNGLTETQQTLLLGWLNQRATSPDSGRRLFSVRDLLSEIGILQDAISLLPGTLKMWRDLWNDISQGVLARTRSCLGNHGQSIPAEKVQPDALAAFLDAKSEGIILLGEGGIGKSAFIAQIAEAARHHGEEVLHCGADDLSVDELERVSDAIRFRAALLLCLRPTSKLFLFVDGLDEAEPPLRKRWAQILVRLRGRSNVRLIASMRDAIWRSDGDVRKQLETWRQISMKLWPVDLVRELLKSVSFETFLPLSVVDLLRTPILLDLFWRTFIESARPDMSHLARLQTRHNLLAAFWQERLLDSTRHARVSDLASLLRRVASHAAVVIGAFLEEDLDASGVQILLSEGVIVREGRLQSRLRFRHPLLRDFALSQWCLETDDPPQVALRWNSIHGGLQRHGVLRAILEALSDRNARNEHPTLELGNVVQAIVRADRALAGQVAQVLGNRNPIRAVDPANWPSHVQSNLPAEFARDLIAAARLNGIGAWAERIVNWPANAGWLDNEYPIQLWRYTTFLFDESRKKPNDLQLREQVRQAARKLRHISELTKFASEFAASERWLKAEALMCVIPILPDEATLAWVEREMLQPSWRTRQFVLDKLIHLAKTDANRTALIYRQAVGLEQRCGRPFIDEARWTGIMDHQAIEWSLAGEDGRRSLLREYPVTFLPVALDLAEALWIKETQDSERRENTMSGTPQALDPSSTQEPGSQTNFEMLHRLGELIDDRPDWFYWRDSEAIHPYQRVVKAVHEFVEHYVNVDPTSFIADIAPVMRGSRIASIQSVQLDILIERKEQMEFRHCLKDSALDLRLYDCEGLTYWVEQALGSAWAQLQKEDREIVLDHLRLRLASSETEDRAKRFLARLPNPDLTEDLQSKRPHDGDKRYRPKVRPIGLSPEVSEGTPTLLNPAEEMEIGEWPASFDLDVLRAFAHITSSPADGGTPLAADVVRERVLKSFEVARTLFASFKEDRHLLEDQSRFWVWESLTQMLENVRKFENVLTGSAVPPPDVIAECVDLALARAAKIPQKLPGRLPEGDTWSGPPQNAWRYALALLEAALTWPPMADGQQIQEKFTNLLQAAFSSNEPLIQLVCTTTVRSWHFCRDGGRLKLESKLVWSMPTHASVLTWSLRRIRFYPDKERVRILKLLLNRVNISKPSELATKLGQYVGDGCMNVFIDGQRSGAAELARQILNAPGEFPLLHELSNQKKFLAGFVFGMKRQARIQYSHSELAFDYGNWVLQAWRLLRLHHKKRNESGRALLHAMHWLERSDGSQVREDLRPWWQHLQPLFNLVILDGGRPDCFTFLYQLSSGSYNDLTTPEELLAMLEQFTERIAAGAGEGIIDLDERLPEEDDHHSWRDCADCVAGAIDSLCRDGSLTTDLHRENAHQLLSRLAAEPIRCSKAIDVLHWLQNL
jgi:hypothetical protein